MSMKCLLIAMLDFYDGFRVCAITVFIPIYCFRKFYLEFSCLKHLVEDIEGEKTWKILNAQDISKAKKIQPC